MHQGDFEEFQAILTQLGETFSKKLTNELTHAYWKALKDLQLTTVARLADTHVRYGKFFPKPSELRPKDAPKEQRSDPAFEEALRRNVANWDERLRENPIRAKWLLLDAYVARISVTEEPGTLAYLERMNFACNACQKLIAESGTGLIYELPNLRHTVSRLLGAEVVNQAIAIGKESQKQIENAA
jgi:hypothetical protein